MNKSLRLPLVISIAVALIYTACTLFFAQGLPDYLATHFDATGRPNGWMPRAGAVRFELAMGLGTQVFLVLLGCCMRFIPARFVNMPHKEYWARPENFFTACRLLMHDFLWLGNLLAMWMILLNYSMAQANRVMPPQLDTSAFLFAMATFAVMLILWFITLWRRFRMPAAESRKRR